MTRRPHAKRALWVCVALSTTLAGCSTFNPFRSSGESGGGYEAPREIGRGACSVEVSNLSSRPLYVYYYLGIENPPRLTSGWPRLGLLEPGQSSVIRADCAKRRITTYAYARAPVDRSRETPAVQNSMTLVEGRRDVIRLRLTR